MLDLSDNFSLNAEEVVTSRTCVTAQSGAGKSYLIGVLCEELLKKEWPFCIIDPEGEYSSLKQKFNLLWVGGENSDVPLETCDLAKLAKTAITDYYPLILDVSEAKNPKAVVNTFCEHLFQAETKLRKPYLLIVEEADKFAPQKGNNDVRIIHDIARRGRKRGLGLLLATQRPAFIDKDVLSQCNNQMIGKLTLKNDLDAVKLFFESTQELKTLMTLEPGYFYFMGDFVDTKALIKSRERLTKHQGYTPFARTVGAINVKNIAQRVERKDASNAERIKPVLSEQEAQARIRLKKRFVFFGRPLEKINSITRIERPLLKTRVKVILGKRIRDLTIIFDGITGIPIQYRNGIIFLKQYSPLIGLDQDEVNTLFHLIGRGSGTIRDVVHMIRGSDSGIRRAIQKLYKHKLITRIGKIENAHVYKPLVYVPWVKRVQFFDTEFPKGEPAKQEKTPFTLEQAREFVKGVDANAEIVSSSVVYYPFYKVTIKAKKTERTVFVDGVSGRKIRFYKAQHIQE
ncbi:hypothetical protein COT72_04415 [archaeon CG10_big_fil_rev_8_21_14_0_10_43_11]|nr:MAG: hypothetical protein COT72_04415 [archaeon CG10_big_fil_rev_8_21_14_0_10_43_11]